VVIRLSSSDKTYHLLENLLIWSRIQADSIRFKPIKIFLNALINENIDLLKPGIKQKQIKITVHIPGNLKTNADNYMLDTIIRNLLSNAIKFTADNGNIEISAKQVGDKVEIAISDTGIGIKKENIDKLFRIEHNLMTVGTNGEKGSGLGLILCKEFIEKHDGKIQVESVEGKGSSFIFTMPKSISD